MNYKNYYLLVAIGAILYLFYGLIQLYNGVISWWFPWIGRNIQVAVCINSAYIPNSFPDPFSGFSLIIIGLILIKALYLYSKGSEKHEGWLFVGWVLSLLMLLLNMIILFANILDAYYPILWGGEPGEWSLAMDPWGIAPHSIVGIILLPLYFKVKKFIKEISPT